MKITGSGETLGATVEGLDLARPLSREDFDGVVRFPGQKLTGRQLADFSGRFGELEINVANASQEMINVPFKGNGPALAEVMAGRVTFMFYPIVGIADQVAAKKIKVLAVGMPRRHPDFPGVPTMAESGLPAE